jgi:tRNA(His) guanylyltransferase
MSTIGNRMKENYELRAKRMLTRRTPVIVRVDGKAFHTFTKDFDRPFSDLIISTMVESAKFVAANMEGCKAFYCQSDEVSFLLTDYTNLQTEAWFGYCQNKIESITASLMTAAFNDEISAYCNELAFFDARAFNIPREEVVNYFLWRMKDWERNSLQMFARSFYTHKQLHNKRRADIHEMLHEVGQNWSDLPDQYKNGTFGLVSSGKIYYDEFTYESLSQVLGAVL